LKAFCPLTRSQAVLYEQSVKELASQLELQKKQASGIARKGLVLSFLMRFKQICNHP
jgi:non-specific serine/threonine protein kinase